METTTPFEENTCTDLSAEVEFLSHKILDLNKQLIDSEKAKSKFLSLVANALNNPIAVLLGTLPRLEPKDDEKGKKIFALAHEEALVLDFRIQNLMAAAEIENGNVDVSYALVDPNELIQEALQSLKYAIQVKNIQVNIQNSLEQKIVSDPKHLYLMIRNLVDNGCTYGIENGIININVRADGPVLLISVQNQGIGPKVEYKLQVFTRFASGPDGSGGLGLGLSIVRDLSEMMEGSIDYFNDETSVTFTLALPLKTVLEDSEALGSNDFMFDSFEL